MPCLLEDLAEHPKRRHLLSAPAEAGCLYPLVCCGALGICTWCPLTSASSSWGFAAHIFGSFTFLCLFLYSCTWTSLENCAGTVLTHGNGLPSILVLELFPPSSFLCPADVEAGPRTWALSPDPKARHWQFSATTSRANFGL